MNPIYSHWCLNSNFGDYLTPFILERFTNREPIWVDPHFKKPFVCVTGSILNHNKPHGINWGTGVAHGADQISNQNGTFAAVRGFKSREKVKLHTGYSPEVGEATLLLPEFYDIKGMTTCSTIPYGYFPHYVDLPFYQHFPHWEATFVNAVVDGPYVVIDKYITSEKIISSSLHGLLLALAFKKPFAWVKWTDKIGGDGFKYHDFFTLTKHGKGEVQDGKLHPNKLKFYDPELSPDVDLEAFKQCFPKQV